MKSHCVISQNLGYHTTSSSLSLDSLLYAVCYAAVFVAGILSKSLWEFIGWKRMGWVNPLQIVSSTSTIHIGPSENRTRWMKGSLQLTLPADVTNIRIRYTLRLRLVCCLWLRFSGENICIHLWPGLGPQGCSVLALINIFGLEIVVCFMSMAGCKLVASEHFHPCNYFLWQFSEPIFTAMPKLYNYYII